tara:strand:- start:7478 stop:12415 length:4938 start_codon:yes stop_codon:yes gene_type:complete
VSDFVEELVGLMLPESMRDKRQQKKIDALGLPKAKPGGVLDSFAEFFQPDVELTPAIPSIIQNIKPSVEKAAREQGFPTAPKIDRFDAVTGALDRLESKEFEDRLNFVPKSERGKVGSTSDRLTVGKVRSPQFRAKDYFDEKLGRVVTGGDELARRDILKRIEQAEAEGSVADLPSLVEKAGRLVPQGSEPRRLSEIDSNPFNLRITSRVPRKGSGDIIKFEVGDALYDTPPQPSGLVTSKQVSDARQQGMSPAFVGFEDETIGDLVGIKASTALDLNPVAAVLSFMQNMPTLSPFAMDEGQRGTSFMDPSKKPDRPTVGGAPSFMVGVGQKLAELYRGEGNEEIRSTLKYLITPAAYFDEQARVYQMGDRDYNDPMRPDVVKLLQEGKTYEQIDDEIGMPAGSAESIHLGKYNPKKEYTAFDQYSDFLDSVTDGMDHIGDNMAALVFGIPSLIGTAYEGIAKQQPVGDALGGAGDVVTDMVESVSAAFTEPGKLARDQGTLLMFGNMMIPFVKSYGRARKSIKARGKSLRDELVKNTNELAKNLKQKPVSSSAGLPAALSGINKAFNRDSLLRAHTRIKKQLLQNRAATAALVAADLGLLMAGHPLGLYDLATSLIRYRALSKPGTVEGVNKRAWWLDSTDRVPIQFQDLVRERMGIDNAATLAMHDAFAQIPEGLRPTAQVHLHMEHMDSPQVVLPSGRRIYANNPEKNLMDYFEGKDGNPGEYRLTALGEKYIKSAEANKIINNSSDAIQLRNQIELANSFNRPLADMLVDTSRRARELGLIGPDTLSVYYPNLWRKGSKASEKGRNLDEAAQVYLNQPLESLGDSSALRINTYRRAAKKWEKDNPNANPSDNPFRLEARIQAGMVSDMSQELFSGAAKHMEQVTTFEFYRDMAKSEIALTRSELQGIRELAASKLSESKRPGLSSRQKKDLEMQSRSLVDIADTYVKMDDYSTLNTGAPSPVPTYGHLQGILETKADGTKTWRRRKPDEELFIQGDVLLEMKNIEKFKSDMAGKVAKLYTGWKGYKTVGSPMAHVRNVAGLVLYLAPMAGISPFNPKNFKYWQMAIKDLSLPVSQRSAYFKEAYKYDALGATVTKAELPVYANELAPLQGGVKNASDLMRAYMEVITNPRLAAVGDNVKSAGKNTYEGARRLYSATDDVGRLVYFYKNLDFMKKAKKETVAGKKALGATTKYRLLDYSNLPNYAQVMRAPVNPLRLAREAGVTALAPMGGLGAGILAYFLGKPFIAFTRQALRQERNYRRNHPIRNAMYMNLYDALTRQNQLAANLDPDLEDAGMRLAPDFIRGQITPMAAFGSSFAKGDRPGQTQFGGKDPESLFSKITNVMPYASIMPIGMRATNNDAASVANFLADKVVGDFPLVSTAINLLRNRDPFYKGPIMDTEGRGANTIAQAVNYAVKKDFPTFTPPLELIFGPAFDAAYEAYYGDKRGFGDVKLGGGTLTNRLMDASKGRVLRTGDEMTMDRMQTEMMTGIRTEALTKRRSLMNRVGAMLGAIRGLPKAFLRAERLPRLAGQKSRGVEEVIDALSTKQVQVASDRMPELIRTLSSFEKAENEDGLMYPEAVRLNALAKQFYVASKMQKDMPLAKSLLARLMKTYRQQNDLLLDYDASRVRETLEKRRGGIAE